MTTAPTTAIVRRGRGLHPRKAQAQQNPGAKGSTLPEYLEAHEVLAVLAPAPNPRARLLMLLQWRAGLRVSEALALEPADLSLDSDQPTIRVRQGKGGRSRMVPVHPELLNALVAVFQFSQIGRGRIIPVSRSTAWQWVQAAVKGAVSLGALSLGALSLGALSLGALSLGALSLGALSLGALSPGPRLGPTHSGIPTPVTCSSTGCRSTT